MLALILLLLADIIVRDVPRPLLVDRVFWMIVAAWTFALFLSFVIGDSTRIRHSIRLTISSGVLFVAGVSALVGFILKLNELYWPPLLAFLTVFTVAFVSEVFQDRRKSRTLPPVTLPPEEKVILVKAQELCHNLQLSQRFNSLYITWTQRYSLRRSRLRRRVPEAQPNVASSSQG